MVTIKSHAKIDKTKQASLVKPGPCGDEVELNFPGHGEQMSALRSFLSGTLKNYLVCVLLCKYAAATLSLTL